METRRASYRAPPGPACVTTMQPPEVKAKALPGSRVRAAGHAFGIWEAFPRCRLKPESPRRNCAGNRVPPIIVAGRRRRGARLVLGGSPLIADPHRSCSPRTGGSRVAGAAQEGGRMTPESCWLCRLPSSRPAASACLARGVSGRVAWRNPKKRCDMERPSESGPTGGRVTGPC